MAAAPAACSVPGYGLRVSSHLADLAEALHTAFAAVPRPAPINACRCCLSEAEEAAALVPEPLSELPRRVIRDLAGNLWYTYPVRGPDSLAGHVRYFAPRLLVDACGPGWSWPPLELLTRRIRLAGWESWPMSEQDGVRVFLHDLWTHTLSAGPGTPDVWGVVCAIGELETDLRPYLSQWDAALRHRGAAEQLLWLLEHAVEHRDGSWQRTHAARTLCLDFRQVAGWLDRVWWSVAEAYLIAESAQLRTVLEEVDFRLPSMPGFRSS
jgi:hypothetical protein